MKLNPKKCIISFVAIICLLSEVTYIAGNNAQASSCQAHGAGYCGLAVTPDASKAYIAFNLSDALMEFDLNNFSLKRCIDTSIAGTMLASSNVIPSPDGNRIYVSNLGTQNIMIANTQSGNIEVVIDGVPPQWGDSMKILKDGGTFFVVTRPGHLALINTTDYSHKTIDIPSVYLLAVSPSANNPNMLYCIGDFTGAGGNSFFSFDLTKKTIVQTAQISENALPAYSAVRRLVIDKSEKTAYFGWLEFGAQDKGYGNLVAFDLESFNVSHICSIDCGVQDLTLNDSNGKVYTIGFWSGGESPGILPITEYDIAAKSITRQLNLSPASDIRAIAVDPVSSSHLYVAEGDHDYIAIIDISSGKIVNKYSFFKQAILPTAVISGGNTGYVVSHGSSKVFKLDLSTGLLTGYFNMPDNIGGATGGGFYKDHLYLCRDKRTIIKVNPNNGSLVQRFSLGIDINPIKLTFFNEKMATLDYVPGTMIGRKFYVFDAKTMQVIKSWDLPAKSHGDEAMVSPDGSKLYYTSGSMGGEAIITIVNGDTLEIQKAIIIPEDPAWVSGRGSTNFSTCYFDETNRRLYLAGFSSLYIIDMDTDELIGIIDLDGISIAMNREFIWTPTGLCAVTLSPDKSMMMTVAGDSNLMYAYDMNTSKWTTELLNIQGFFPTDAITSIDGKYLYTVNQHSDNITMIDISKRQVVGLISLIANSDGDLAPLGNRDGSVNIGDALVALRFSLNLETPTQEDIAHGDVAPLDADNKPNPDGVLTVGDALVILRKALGIISF